MFDVAPSYVRSDLYITLKALANSSPGFALKPWVTNVKRIWSQPWKGLPRRRPFTKTRRNSFRVATNFSMHCYLRVSEQTLGWN